MRSAPGLTHIFQVIPDGTEMEKWGIVIDGAINITANNIVIASNS